MDSLFLSIKEPITSVQAKRHGNGIEHPDVLVNK